MISGIVTHPGGAHKDDFLACSLMVAKYRVPVYRREPTQADVENPDICVIDVGGQHDDTKMNFDHHQFPRDFTPTCALSLVLNHLQIYDDARNFCDWLETAEWIDTRGPVDTAAWLGVDRDVMAKLNSPIDMTIIRRFGAGTSFTEGDLMWQIMQIVGDDMLHFILQMREKLEYLREHVELWSIDGSNGKQAAFLPRLDSVPDDASSGMIRYVLMMKNPEIVALIYPDRRGEGYGLSRMNDCKNMEYSKLQHEPDVHFAHSRGFIAKTSAVDISRLKQLLTNAYTTTPVAN